MQDTLVRESAPARAEPQAILRRWEWLAITVIALGAFALRAWTVRGGLPYVDHPDEPNPINYVVQMLRTGDPNPHAFQKPSLYIYLLLAVLQIHYRWGLATRLYQGLDQMTITTSQYTTIPGFFLWGRMLTVVIATLTVVSLFMLGRRVWSRGAGLVAALFLAVSAFHMRHSQYVTTDVASAWLVLLAFGGAVAIARGGRWRDYLAAGAFAGLASATKYNAGVAALPLIAAHVLYWRRRSALAEGASAAPAAAWLIQLPRLAGAGAAALLGFAIGTPYAVLSWAEFRRGILGQVEDYSAITHGDFTGAWNLRGYAGFFWGEGLGPVACAALIGGLALLLWRRREVGLLWFSFAVPYMLLHLAQSSHFVRNMVPLIVLSALPIGVACAALIGWLGRATEPQNHRTTEPRTTQRVPDREPPRGYPTENHGTENREPRAESHRVKHLPAAQRLAPSAQRLRCHLVTGSGSFLFRKPLIAVGLRIAAAAAVLLVLLLPTMSSALRYSARLWRGDTRVQALNWIDMHIAPGVRVAAELRPLPGPLESRWTEAPGLLRHDLAWYRRQGYGYVVASSDVWEQWSIPETYRRFAAGPPVAEFGGADPRAMLGPHLVVYATGLSAADVPEPASGDVRVGGARLLGLAVGQPEKKAPQLGVQPAHSFKAGEALGIRTFWSVERPFERDFFIFVHLVDAGGATVAQRDAPPWQGRFPTSSWRAGTLVVDLNDLALPAGLPPGEYTVAIGMFDPATAAHPLMSLDGQPLDRVPAAVIRITR